MNQSLQDSWLDCSDLNTTVSKSKPTSTCPVCQLRIRLTSSGVFYNHGPRDFPCPGVDTYPVPATLNDNNASQHVSTQEQNITSSQPLDSIQSKLFLHLSGNLPPMIKWILRSARQHCASL